MKRVLFLMICVGILSGCSPVKTNMLKPEQSPKIVSSSDMALLVIIRDSSFGEEHHFLNYLDGKFIGETIGKTFFITNISPGIHYIVSETENTGVAKLNFIAGKKYFLRQGVVFGILRLRTTGFFPITAEEAQKVIPGCTYLQLDANKTFPDMKPDNYKKAIEEYQFGLNNNHDGYKELLEYKGE